MKLPRRTIPASGSGRCRAAGSVADRAGASLSVAAGAHRRRLPAGGANSTVARLIGSMAAGTARQPFIVENRPGAGSNIATEAVVRAPRRWLYASACNLGQRHQCDALRQAQFQFHPRHRAGREHHPRTARHGGQPAVPAKTVPEFIAYAKANPGKINMASAGNGHTTHLCRRIVQDR